MVRDGALRLLTMRVWRCCRGFKGVDGRDPASPTAFVRRRTSARQEATPWLASPAMTAEETRLKPNRRSTGKPAAPRPPSPPPPPSSH